MGKSDRKLLELHALRAWCITVVEYIIEVDESSAYLIRQFREVVDNTFEKNNLRGLKIIKKDLQEFVGDLSVDQRKKLAEILAIDENYPLEDMEKKVKNILGCGYINEDADYRFLNYYISSRLEKDSMNEDEVSKINTILLNYLGK